MIGKRTFQIPTASDMQNDDNKKLKLEDEWIDIVVNNCIPEAVSTYIPKLASLFISDTADKLLNIHINLNNQLRTLNFINEDIRYSYNPLEYAFELYVDYVRKFCNTTKKILFVGMNPGPFGMCQTGVPFGDPHWVKDWLRIEGDVSVPPVECPERKIYGLASKRKEISGDRFWSFFSGLCGEPEKFFENSFVINFCPLMFMQEGGKNITPTEIRDAEFRRYLEKICCLSYFEIIKLLKPEVVVAVGHYVERKTKHLFKRHNINNVRLACMPHPSPRAGSETNWQEKADEFLTSNNLKGYFEDINCAPELDLSDTRQDYVESSFMWPDYETYPSFSHYFTPPDNSTITVGLYS